MDEWYDKNMGLCALGLQPYGPYSIVKKYDSEGSLDLDSFHSLNDLPANLTVNGTLYIGYTSISELPIGLKVNGLSALFSKLKRLPDGFTVPGNIDIEGCPITELPANLKVNKLDIRRTGISEIPGTMVANTLFIAYTALADRFNNDVVKVTDYIKGTGAQVDKVLI
jgi:hypothetical protein